MTPGYWPDSFTGTIPVNVVLTGTLQVCLEPANVQTHAGVVACDPQYSDFAVININVAGQALFSVFRGDLVTRASGDFQGTSAAAPEPSQLGAMGGAALLIWALIGKYSRQHQ